MLGPTPQCSMEQRSPAYRAQASYRDVQRDNSDDCKVRLSLRVSQVFRLKKIPDGKIRSSTMDNIKTSVLKCYMMGKKGASKTTKKSDGSPSNSFLRRGLKMIAVTINCYAEAIKLGSKFVYQTVPRLLALWDVAVSTKNRTSTQPRPNQQIEDAEVNKINDIIVNAFRTAPIYQVSLPSHIFAFPTK